MIRRVRQVRGDFELNITRNRRYEARFWYIGPRPMISCGVRIDEPYFDDLNLHDAYRRLDHDVCWQSDRPRGVLSSLGAEGEMILVKPGVYTVGNLHVCAWWQGNRCWSYEESVSPISGGGFVKIDRGDTNQLFAEKFYLEQGGAFVELYFQGRPTGRPPVGITHGHLVPLISVVRVRFSVL